MTGPSYCEFVFTAKRFEFNVFELFFQNPIVQMESGNTAIHLYESMTIEKDKH